jgi:RNA polymerase sigma-70 factor (ECF subfamily)
LQETFAYVLRKFPGFQLTASMTTFLYPAVRNLSMAVRRKRGREVTLSGEMPNAASPDCRASTASGHGETTRADLAAVMAALPAPQREVVLMQFVDDMSLQEIAQALGVPLGPVKSRLHHALAALRADPHTRTYFDA